MRSGQRKFTKFLHSSDEFFNRIHIIKSYQLDLYEHDVAVFVQALSSPYVCIRRQRQTLQSNAPSTPSIIQKAWHHSKIIIYSTSGCLVEEELLSFKLLRNDSHFQRECEYILWLKLDELIAIGISELRVGTNRSLFAETKTMIGISC